MNTANTCINNIASISCPVSRFATIKQFLSVRWLLCLSCLFWLQPSSAYSYQSSKLGNGLRSVQQQAEQYYQTGRFEQAEPLYRHLLVSADALRKREYVERLFDIYLQTGRRDQAIQLGQEHQRWLLARGERIEAQILGLRLGNWYLSLGHYKTAEQLLLQNNRELREDQFPPAQRATALTQLALAIEKQPDDPRDPQRAKRVWLTVEAFLRRQLQRPTRDLDWPARVSCTQGLAECLRFQQRPAEALPLLDKLLQEQHLRKDWAGQRDTLRQLASLLSANKQYPEAKRRLQEAQRLHEQHRLPNGLLQGDMLREFADILEVEGNLTSAGEVREQALKKYEVVWQEHKTSQMALAVFWRLQELYQQSNRSDKALQLSANAREMWQGPLLRPRFQIEIGRLLAFQAKNREEARPLLKNAVTQLEQQTPRNLVEYPRALLTWGALELTSRTGTISEAQGSLNLNKNTNTTNTELVGPQKAKDLGEQIVAFYEQEKLPDDMVLIEAYNLMGNSLAYQGEYAEALKQFKKGLDRSEKLKPALDPQRCGLFLNVALLHKAQGDIDNALEMCQEARQLFANFAGSKAPGLAAFDAARAGMLSAQVKIDEAKELATKVLEMCQRHEIPGESLLESTARHCLALHYLKQKRLQAAEEQWRLVDQLDGKESPLRPRTLNYLGLVEEHKGNWAEARRYYEQALPPPQKRLGAFPVTHFTTLWRLSEVARRQNRTTEARKHLEEAIQVVDKARLRTYGGTDQRVAFFSQFAPGIERLVEWSVLDKDIDGALLAVARGRSRALTDHLLNAGINPFATLPPERLEQEKKLSREITALQAQAQLASEFTAEMQQQIEQKQQEYAKVYQELIAESPLLRSLQPEFTRANLNTLRDQLGKRKQLLAVYHVGKQNSFLLLMGGRDFRAVGYPLSVPTEIADLVAAPKQESINKAKINDLKGKKNDKDFKESIVLRNRGIRILLPIDQPELPQIPQRPQWRQSVGLSDTVLRNLLENFRPQVASDKFSPNRGLRLETRDKERPLPSQRPELLSTVLLPQDAIAQIKTHADGLIIIPDGALHGLPLECLPLQSGKRTQYVMDVFPPTSYAPSLYALALLANRLPSEGSPLRSLLTVANPTYPILKESKNVSDQPEVGRLVLPPLPSTESESLRIEAIFKKRKSQIVPLRGQQATRSAVLQSLNETPWSVIHLAAHGLASKEFGNQFGALAFTPGKDDSGYLLLSDITKLSLTKCELAVLSACDTFYGPQPPMEAGVTLASGFLTAGVRRVVASHWQVDDEATAVLMETFFAEVTELLDKKATMPYARALQNACRKVRQMDQNGWDKPFYWAPFVLVGTGD